MKLHELALMGPQLTDRKIDRYCIRGAYGEARRDAIIDAIISGKERYFDTEILRGDFGPELRARLKRAIASGDRKVRSSSAAASAAREERIKEAINDFLGL